MALKVLLRRTIDGVGEVGEIVRVRNGYARNFLLPKGYASVVSAVALRRFSPLGSLGRTSRVAGAGGHRTTEPEQ